MMEYSFFLETSWTIISILLIFLGFFKNCINTRIIANILFLMYFIIAGFRAHDYNNDTYNYYLLLQSAYDTKLVDIFSFVLNDYFEPAWCLLTYLFSLFISEKYYFLFIAFVTSIVFNYTFLRFDYHPIIITFIFITVVYVSSVSAIRHLLSLSIIFLIFSIIFIDKKRPKNYFLFIPLLFHISSSVIIALILFKEYIYKNFNLRILLSLIIIFFILIFLTDIITIGYLKLLDRMNDGGNTTGLRNILVLLICLLFLIRVNLKKYIIKIEKIDFYLAIVLFLSISFVFMPGLNRITSFLSLIPLVYFQINYVSNNSNFISLNLFGLNFINFLSLLFFYSVHSTVG